MSKIKLLLTTILFSTLLYGCGESIYSGAADTSTNEAVKDQIDFDLINGNCKTVVDYYDNRLLQDAVLDQDELYKYLSAVLMCNGFDLVGGIEDVLTNGANDVYATSAALMGVNKIDVNISKSLIKGYSKATDLCAKYINNEVNIKGNKYPSLNNTNSVLCGFAGISNSMINLSDLMLASTGGGAEEMELSEKGITDLGTAIIPMQVGSNVASYFSENNQFPYTLNVSLLLSEKAGESIGNMMGNSDFTSAIQQFSQSLRDENGDITSDSMLQFIADMTGIEIPDLPEIPVSNVE